MRRWLALAAGLLLASPPAAADMFQDATNAKLPDARYNLNLGTAATPLDFDPLCDGSAANATHDCSAAIAQALTVTRNGQAVNVYLPAGRYYVKNPITIVDGRCLSGDSRRNTFLHIDQTFSPAATGVVNLNYPQVGDGFAKYTPCVKDLAFEFDQPSTQGTRANFAVLGSCTSGAGGTGCKYPPAIYQPVAPAAGGMTIQNIRIERAWDGINLQHASSIDIENIEESSLNVGLTLENGHNFGHVSHWVHYGWGIDGASALYTGVYEDGNAYAAKIGALDGGVIDDFRTWEGRVALTAGFSWGLVSNLALDGKNSTLEVAHTSAGIGLIASNVYATGSAVGANTHCQIDIASGSQAVTINNLVAGTANNAGPSAVCVAGGVVQIAGGLIGNGSTGAPSVKVTGGQAKLTGLVFNSLNQTYTAPLISVAGGSITATGNTIKDLPFNAANQWINIATDNALNYVEGNQSSGWAAALGFATALGYYDFGAYKFTDMVVTPGFATPGDFAPTSVSTGGWYYRRGNYVEFLLTSTFNANAYTTASGAFSLAYTGMPGAQGPAGFNSCTLNFVDKVTFTGFLTCSVLSSSIAPSTNLTGALHGSLTTTGVPAGTTAVKFGLSGRYMVRG
jgi:hypothetical protein